MGEVSNTVKEELHELWFKEMQPWMTQLMSYPVRTKDEAQKDESQGRECRCPGKMSGFSVQRFWQSLGLVGAASHDWSLCTPVRRLPASVQQPFESGVADIELMSCLAS